MLCLLGRLNLHRWQLHILELHYDGQQRLLELHDGRELVRHRWRKFVHGLQCLPSRHQEERRGLYKDC